MKPTGKNKEQFEKWFKKNYTEWNLYSKISCIGVYPLTSEMQIGVYLAYYDSIDYVVDVMYIFPFEKFTYEVENKKGNLNLPYKEKSFETRIEAYKEAFKKVNKLINKSLEE